MRSRVVRPCLLALALLALACVDEPVIDPGDVTRVQIATSTAQEGWAVNYPKQRKLLAMGNRLWIAYSDGRDAWVRSTADGLTLTRPFLLRPGAGFGHRLGCASDGTHFHCAFNSALSGEDVLYRRGRPLPDGTIAWSAPEQVAYDVPDGLSVMYPKIVVDRAGRPWVAFLLFRGGYMTAPQDALVVRSDRSDGTWRTSTGFPFVLAAGSQSTYPDPAGVALTSGGTYWVVDPDGDDFVRGRLWNGAWQPEERASNERSRHALYDLVADGDDVHLAYGGGTIRYRRRDSRAGWGGETVLTRRASGHESITLVRRGVVLVTWLDHEEDRVVQREVVSGEPGPWLSIFEGAPRGLAGARLGINLNGLVVATGPFLSAVTVTVGQEAPFDVWLATRRAPRPGP